LSEKLGYFSNPKISAGFGSQGSQIHAKVANPLTRQHSDFGDLWSRRSQLQVVQRRTANWYPHHHACQGAESQWSSWWKTGDLFKLDFHLHDSFVSFPRVNNDCGWLRILRHYSLWFSRGSIQIWGQWRGNQFYALTRSKTQENRQVAGKVCICVCPRSMTLLWSYCRAWPHIWYQALWHLWLAPETLLLIMF